MAFLYLPITENDAKPATKFEHKGAWGQLSDLYKMRIRLCNNKGVLIPDSTLQVIGVALDGDVSIEAQYSTPFENSNPEHRLPTLMGMLQSGDWVNTLEIGLSNVFGVDLSEEKKKALNTLEGRSNLTKVNSTQIFVSSQPITITTTLYFSAWYSAKHEVEEQIALLQQWALPQELQKESITAGAMKDKSLESLFPSTVPPYVALYYGGKRYAPMLIQSVSAPLVLPMDSDGNRMYAQVQVTFVSRTAWDKTDIEAIYQG